MNKLIGKCTFDIEQTLHLYLLFKQMKLLNLFSYSYLPFTTMGSGSLAAVSILEAKYKDDLTIEEGKALVIEAVEAGILHDLGSGSNVDLCILMKGKTELLRNYKTDNKRIYEKKIPYDFPIGNTRTHFI